MPCFHNFVKWKFKMCNFLTVLVLKIALILFLFDVLFLVLIHKALTRLFQAQSNSLQNTLNPLWQQECALVQISSTVANYNVIAINRLNQGISSTAKSSPSGKCSLCRNEIILSFWNSALKSSIYTRRMTLNTGELVNRVQAHILNQS